MLTKNLIVLVITNPRSRSAPMWVLTPIYEQHNLRADT